MNLDIAYEGAHAAHYISNIKRKLDSNSVSLAVIAPCDDKLWDKKTLFNTLSVLRDDGIIAVLTTFESVGSIIAICEESKFRWYPCCHYSVSGDKGSNHEPTVIIFITKQASGFPTLLINNPNLYEILVNGATTPQDVVLVVGNEAASAGAVAKRLCRHVVAFLSIKSQVLENEGVSSEYLSNAS